MRPRDPQRAAAPGSYEPRAGTTTELAGRITAKDNPPRYDLTGRLDRLADELLALRLTLAEIAGRCPL